MADEPASEDPYRVDPDRHRGHDRGILGRYFELRFDRRFDDPAGPRPLPRDRDEERER